MAVEEVPPARVADLGGPVGRGDDVGEQDGGEHSIGFGFGSCAGDELFDLGGDCFAVAKVRNVVLAGEFDVAGVGDVFCEVAAVLGSEPMVVGAVDDEGRDLNDGQDGTDVASELQVEDGFCDCGAGGTAQRPGDPVMVRVVIGCAGSEDWNGAGV